MLSIKVNIKMNYSIKVFFWIRKITPRKIDIHALLSKETLDKSSYWNYYCLKKIFFFIVRRMMFHATQLISMALCTIWMALNNPKLDFSPRPSNLPWFFGLETWFWQLPHSVFSYPFSHQMSLVPFYKVSCLSLPIAIAIKLFGSIWPLASTVCLAS